LDNLILGRDSQLTAVCSLSELISETLTNPQGVTATSAPANPAALTVINRAIGDSNLLPKGLTTVKELVEEAARISQTLRDVSNDTERPVSTGSLDVDKLRAFCLALSRVASAQEQSFHDLRPPHPYRR
jgi:hypothetical protein